MYATLSDSESRLAHSSITGFVYMHVDVCIECTIYCDLYLTFVAYIV